MSLKPKHVNFDETWADLKETVQGVVTLGNVKRIDWNSRFNDVYSLCVAHPEPLAEQLYSETCRFLEDHVAGLLKRVCTTADGSNNLDSEHSDALLQRYYDAWTEYSQGISYLNNLYLYLNQQHVKRQKVSEAEILYGNSSNIVEKLEIGELGLWSWERGLVRPLQKHLVSRILSGYQASREEKPHQSEILRAVIHSLVKVQQYKKKQHLALYMELVEEPILEATGVYCQCLAAKLLQLCDVSSYLKEIIAGLDKEMVRGKQFLYVSSMHKLYAVYEKYMVAEHLDILHAECQTMVVENKVTDLKNLYAVLKNINNGLKPLLDIMHNHIKEQGLRAIADLRGDSIHNTFVENILATHTKFKNLFAQVFDSDVAFLRILEKACSAIINSKTGDQPCRSPELLARYCDTLLKKTSRTVAETEADDKLTASIIIFKYIDDKDIFQKFYARLMAKRLIHQQSHSMDQEEAMINRLKQACGYEFTNKLLRMFTDIAISGDLNTKFIDFMKNEPPELGMGFGIHILQAGAWPLSATQGGATSALPPQLERPIQLFEKFYYNSYSGRKLTWLHHLCMGELKLCYPKKPYYVTMQTSQMSIMLEFEKVDSRTVTELMKATRLPADALARNLSALVESHLVNSSGNLENVETEISLNLEFISKRTKVRVAASGGGPVAQAAKEQAEAERTAASVEEDRKMYLQAAIVRIMKARKILRHNDLIQEVLSQAKSAFAPNIAMIKKCIETLIDKQYIERTPGVSDEYSYVA